MEKDNAKNVGLVFAIVFIVVVSIGVSFTMYQDSQEEVTDENGIQVSEGMNIVQEIQENEDLTSLSEAIILLELNDVLADTSSEFTIFAPSDNAFANLDEFESLQENENISDLQNLLQYHVVASKNSSSELFDEQIIETLNGEYIKIRIVDDSLYVNQAIVTTRNIQATNGVIHILDKVLVPGSFDNLVEFAQDEDDLDSFLDYIIEFELVETLTDEFASFTIFAPTDAAFNEAEDVLNEIPEQQLDEQLENILRYHIVDSEIFTTELEDGQIIQTLDGKNININIEDGEFYLEGENFKAKITEDSNIIKSNGLVHKIDSVLIP